MLYITSFTNYEEFLSLFGIREFNGKKSRKNKILLSFLKDKNIHKYCIEKNDFRLLSINNMAELKSILMNKIQVSSVRSNKPHTLYLLGKTYHSNIYSTDHAEGICEDGTPNAIRYINHDSERVFKMKAGKILKHIIDNCKFGHLLNKTVTNWLCEEFTMDWSAHVVGSLPKNKLYVNDNFKDIYDRERMMRDGNEADPFTSCMTNRGLHTFYRDAVKAKAAYLENEHGQIIARCIIFTEVFDETGKVWRYAERAYSYHINLVYQRALIDALIEGGHIDCYKKIGAGCSDANAIVDIHGNSLADKEFKIECDLDWGDSLSYQDSFKWYSEYKREAYNYEPSCSYLELDITNGQLSDDDDDPEPDEYDDVHECFCYEVTEVHYRGRILDCDTERLSDFTMIDGEWYYNGDDDEDADWVECPVCGHKMPNPKYWAEKLYQFELDRDSKEEVYVCSDECLEQMEDDYKEEHWFFSDYDDAYYEHEEDLATYLSYNRCSGDYEEMTISKKSLESDLKSGHLFKWGDECFDEVNPRTKVPYGYETEIEQAA